MGFSMKNCARIAVILTAASFCFLLPVSQALGQELNAEAKSKEAVEARNKRNAQIFQNNASVLTFLNRYGKPTGKIGERALYEDAVLSPDGKRIAIIKDVWRAVSRSTTPANTVTRHIGIRTRPSPMANSVRSVRKRPVCPQGSPRFAGATHGRQARRLEQLQCLLCDLGSAEVTI